MTLHAFSRRRLLGGLLAGLTAWLCPRSPRAAAPCRTKPALTHQHYPTVFHNTYTYVYEYNASGCDSKDSFVTTYAYDANDRGRKGGEAISS